MNTLDAYNILEAFILRIQNEDGPTDETEEALEALGTIEPLCLKGAETLNLHIVAPAGFLSEQHNSGLIIKVDHRALDRLLLAREQAIRAALRVGHARIHFALNVSYLWVNEPPPAGDHLSVLSRECNVRTPWALQTFIDPHVVIFKEGDKSASITFERLAELATSAGML